ncbi:glucokinase [Spongiibacter sp. KMU-158]|uniref:Glucokinase n=1 Tax=Spongiibacter pelagi TaxID=2760804 RepID=A0A927C4U2_9GAMM|nr:glucokinase [Spongiibacter pelagi]MBD2859601.1 glucokinase [Spongiibacter pelagi]
MKVPTVKPLHIVADIGGTHGRFARVSPGSLALSESHDFSCAEFSSLIDLIKAYLDQLDESPISACFAIAAPLVGEQFHMPNRGWRFGAAELEAALGFPIKLINDFNAQALSLKSISAQDCQLLGSRNPFVESPSVPAGNTKAILGPGTGLGVAGLLANGSVLVSEGGHISFAPVNEHEYALLNLLWQHYERVSIERVLSGMGLSNLYWANSVLCKQEQQLTPPEITQKARGGDPIALQAVQDFTGILGSAAGDVALMMGAYSGVFLSGGMLEKMQGLIDVKLLRQRFESKGRYRPICEQIPLAITQRQHAGLIGCAQAILDDNNE